MGIAQSAKFNDDVMESITNSSLQNSLENLELIDVSISDRTASQYLRRFSHLDSLVISDCNAITASGEKMILTSQNIQNGVKNILFDGFITTPEIIDLYDGLRTLAVLVIGNPSGMQMDRAVHLFCNLKIIKDKNIKFMCYEGPLFPPK